MRKIILLLVLLIQWPAFAQDYFLEKYKPFDAAIPSPEEFLGYGIGEQHTRHDRIVAYLETLAETSENAMLTEYGRTHEGRRLVMLQISSPGHLEALESLRAKHLEQIMPGSTASGELPVFINLAYNVHGNEPSSSEAAMLSAYTLVASQNPEIQKYREDAVIFVDPTINPDGRDRHTHWANSFKGKPLVADPQDIEHQEAWPGGRTNHYWFDLNRDWLLAIHPESRGKLNWYHKWYPNVVTDFHEMGTQSSYFFEPMKPNGSFDPIMPKENYEDLNELFGDYYAQALDSIGSLYFTKEVFDGTYPGYGSSYPDLQGGLGLLFEQASSRGHKQKTAYGEITFPFTIRNQFLSSITTVKATVENAERMQDYQKRFFQSALQRARTSKIAGYTFNTNGDMNRLKAFMDKLLLHRIKVYEDPSGGYVVPTEQPQYRMVQTMFETYDKYRDSVYYDASAWSVANFYNVQYKPVRSLTKGSEITSKDQLPKPVEVSKSDYAYVIDWNDYNAPALLHHLQSEGLVLASAFKPFTVKTTEGNKSMGYGSLLLPVSLQDEDPNKVFDIIKQAQQRFQVPIFGVRSGYSLSGVDLGSRYLQPLEQPKAAMVVGQGVRSYEAGEVWHLLDTRVNMPITKIPSRNMHRADLSDYNVLVMVSGSYNFDESLQEKIKNWVQQGNTLVTIGTASKWVVEKEWVEEKLVEEVKDTTASVKRMPYVDAPEISGREEVGGVIVSAELDLTHPLAFGYKDQVIPVYKNNEVWLSPSSNPYATVADYTDDPHIDGYLSEKNLETFMSRSASLLVSPLGKGRVVLFADNPNFRGSWYGTNKLFLNALFLGQHIQIPSE